MNSSGSRRGNTSNLPVYYVVSSSYKVTGGDRLVYSSYCNNGLLLTLVAADCRQEDDVLSVLKALASSHSKALETDSVSSMMADDNLIKISEIIKCGFVLFAAISGRTDGRVAQRLHPAARVGKDEQPVI